MCTDLTAGVIKQNVVSAKEWLGKSCYKGYQGGCDYYQKLNE